MNACNNRIKTSMHSKIKACTKFAMHKCTRQTLQTQPGNQLIHLFKSQLIENDNAWTDRLNLSGHRRQAHKSHIENWITALGFSFKTFWEGPEPSLVSSEKRIQSSSKPRGNTFEFFAFDHSSLEPSHLPHTPGLQHPSSTILCLANEFHQNISESP